MDSNWGSPPHQSFERAGKRISSDIVKEYLEYRFSRVTSEKSKKWIRKVITELMNRTKRIISRESLIQFQNWYKSNYSYESQYKYHAL